MNLFSKMFGNSENKDTNESPVPWRALTDMQQLLAIRSESAQIPVLIFKHSTRCGISRMALQQFERQYDRDAKIVPYFLDLLKYRELSAEIAKTFSVQHESPQLLLIRNGECIYDASHSDISINGVKKKLNPNPQP